MKHKMWIICLCVIFWQTGRLYAQVGVGEVIAEGSKKVIMAIDLQVQRIQNETVWLQNAQKELENVLSQVKLDEISEWAEKQKELYGNYFEELWQVKEVISYYHRVKEITEKQIAMVNSYTSAFALFSRDTHFTPDELDYMGRVYSGMIDASLRNLDELSTVIEVFASQMSDAERLQIIDQVAGDMDHTYQDLKAFNNHNKLLSLQRARVAGDVGVVKSLYGLQ